MTTPEGSRRPDDLAPPGAERRTTRRCRCNREVALRPLPDTGQQTYWASVQNASRGGVGLLLSHFFPPGTALALGLPGQGRGESILLDARVVHAGRKMHGNAYLGCAFAADPGDAALEALGAAREPSEQAGDHLANGRGEAT